MGTEHVERADREPDVTEPSGGREAVSATRIVSQRRSSPPPPDSLMPATLALLQSRAGNRAVSRLVGGVSAPKIQRSDLSYEKGEVAEARNSTGRVDGSPEDERQTVYDFDPGSSTLKPAHEEHLRALVTSVGLRGVESGARVTRVEGFTDAVGGERTNSSLRSLRAEAVARFLIDEGVDPNNIETVTAAPAGEYRSSNGSPAGRSRNRSVEIEVQVVAAAKPSIEGLERELKTRRRVLEDLDSHYKESVGYERQIYDSMKRWETGVDVTASVAMILKGLVQLSRLGLKAANLASEEVVREVGEEAAEEALKKVNEEALKAGAKFAAEPAAEATGKALTESVGDDAPAVVLLGKSVVGAFFDMSSPSFWAHTFVQLSEGKSWGQAVSHDPEEEHRARLRKLERAHRASVSSQRHRIAELERALKTARDGEP